MIKGLKNKPYSGYMPAKKVLFVSLWSADTLDTVLMTEFLGRGPTERGWTAIVGRMPQ